VYTSPVEYQRYFRREPHMRKVYVVDLSEEEKAQLQSLTKKGKTSARKLNRARVLLLADQGETDQQIAKAVGVGTSTVERIRKRFVTEGSLEAALTETSPSRRSAQALRQAGSLPFSLGFR
jgi:ParB-like chromosome segregation protein Spo0J